MLQFTATTRQRARATARREERRDDPRQGVLDVSLPRDSRRTLVHGLASLAAAAGLVLLVPVVMLLVGLPVVLAVRGLLHAIDWLVALAGS
jgi:hypothetical protein